MQATVVGLLVVLAVVSILASVYLKRRETAYAAVLGIKASFHGDEWRHIMGEGDIAVGDGVGNEVGYMIAK